MPFRSNSAARASASGCSRHKLGRRSTLTDHSDGRCMCHSASSATSAQTLNIWQLEMPAGQTHDLWAGTTSERIRGIIKLLTGGRGAEGGGRPLCCAAAASCRNFASAFCWFFCLQARLNNVVTYLLCGLCCCSRLSAASGPSPMARRAASKRCGFDGPQHRPHRQIGPRYNMRTPR